MSARAFTPEEQRLRDLYLGAATFKTTDQHLGIVSTLVTKNKVVSEMLVTENHVQYMGILHGGVNVVLAETVASIGSTVNVDDDRACVGLEINANHLRPGILGDTMVATGVPLSVSRTSQVWSVEIRSKRTGKLICISRCTTAVVDRKGHVSKAHGNTAGTTPAAAAAAAAAGKGGAGAAAAAHKPSLITDDSEAKRDKTEYSGEPIAFNPADVYLGVGLTEITAEKVVAEMPVTQNVVQYMGILHGGVNVSLAETVASVGSTALIDPSKACVGLEINANHLRPGLLGDTMVATGVPVSVSKHSQVWSIEIRSKTTGKLVCIARCTTAIVGKEKHVTKAVNTTAATAAAVGKAKL